VFSYKAYLDFDTEQDTATVTISLDGSDFKVRVESPVRTRGWRESAKDVAKILVLAEIQFHKKMQSFADTSSSQSNSPDRAIIPTRINIKSVSLWPRIKTFFRTLFS
jgi:hypothetical protein